MAHYGYICAACADELGITGSVASDGAGKLCLRCGDVITERDEVEFLHGQIRALVAENGNLIGELAAAQAGPVPDRIDLTDPTTIGTKTITVLTGDGEFVATLAALDYDRGTTEVAPSNGFRNYVRNEQADVIRFTLVGRRPYKEAPAIDRPDLQAYEAGDPEDDEPCGGCPHSGATNAWCNSHIGCPHHYDLGLDAPADVE